MDPSVMLILSNLLHLHNHLDPSSSLLTSPSPSPPSSSQSPHPSSSSSAAAPLLFFALASALSLAQPQPPPSSSPGNKRKRPPRPRVPRPFPPSSSASLLLSLTSSDRVWSMPPALRDSRFRSLLGLSYPLFATLLDHLRDHPTLHSPTPATTSLSLDQSLSLALSRLSRGLSSRSLSRLLTLPPSLISRATHSLTRLLSTRLYSHYVKPPLSSHRLLSTLSSFHDLSSLPSLAGALCSSPVRLRQKNNNNMLLSSSNPNSCDVNSLFSPQRPFPSLLLQAVADPRRIFWDACVRAPGGSDPASHLRDSSLYRRLSDPADPLLKEPPPTASVRPYLAGDVSFPLLPFLLTPFASRDPSPAQEAFDVALGKARASSVEPAVALLKGRWKILRNLNVGLDHAAQTVVACVVLHNMCQIAGEPEDEGRYFWRDPPETQQPARPVESERSMYYQGESLRQALADDLYERQQRLSGGTGR